MSVAALNWAWSLPLLHPLKNVLTVLANHANTEGWAWPSSATIAFEAGIGSLRTVASATKRLETLGLIEVERSPGRVANRYLVRVGERALNPAPGALLSVRSTPHLVRSTPHLTTSNPAPGAPKPSRTTKNQKRGARAHTNSRRRKFSGPPKIPTLVPAHFDVTEDMTAWAEGHGLPRLDVQLETDQFLDRHRAKGTVFKDWAAAWRTWMRNAVRFRAERAPPKDDKPWKPGVYS